MVRKKLNVPVHTVMNSYLLPLAGSAKTTTLSPEERRNLSHNGCQDTQNDSFLEDSELSSTLALKHKKKKFNYKMV